MSSPYRSSRTPSAGQSAFAEVEEIDKINIYHAGLLAMQRAVEGLRCKPEFILVDARKIPHCAVPQRGIIRGDALSASIAAASISQRRRAMLTCSRWIVSTLVTVSPHIKVIQPPNIARR